MGRPMGVIVLAVALLVGAVFHFIVPFTDFGIGSWLTATSVSREHVDPAAATAAPTSTVTPTVPAATTATPTTGTQAAATATPTPTP